LMNWMQLVDNEGLVLVEGMMKENKL